MNRLQKSSLAIIIIFTIFYSIEKLLNISILSSNSFFNFIIGLASFISITIYSIKEY
ncbi:MAG: hypothetical protein RR646_04100 [Erysipelotrichaceae bacterium]